VEIDHELVHLKFEGIEGRVALMPLLLQTIRATRGSVRSALIEVKRRTRPSTPGPPVFLPRWLITNGRAGTLAAAATLTVPNGFRLDVKPTSAALRSSVTTSSASFRPRASLGGKARRQRDRRLIAAVARWRPSA